MRVAYLNGRFSRLEDARVSVLDRGFVFGDGVYEVIPVYHGRLFRPREHLARLSASLDAVRIPDPHSGTEWLRLLEDLVDRNGGGRQSVYLQVTRGVAERNHVFPAAIEPTVFATSQSAEDREEMQALTAFTRPDFRWLRCDIKSTCLLANVLLRQEAVDAGGSEVILLREGFVTEGAATNVFVSLDGTVATPPKSNLILPGITRDFVLELMARAGIPHREGPIRERELHAADEIWLTSSTTEVASVVRLDDRSVGDGAPGEVGQRMWESFQEHKRAHGKAA